MAARRASGRSRIQSKLDQIALRFHASSSEARETWATQNDAMFQAAATRRTGSRRRALAPVAGGVLVLGGMFQMVSANVLAVNFTTSVDGFDVYSNYLDAAQAAGYLAPTSKYGPTEQGVLEVGIKTAKLDGLCAIVNETLPAPLNNIWALKVSGGNVIPDTYTGTGVPAGITLDGNGKLSGGTLTNAVTADNLYLNASKLEGYGNLISGMNLGQSAETVAASAGLPAFQGQQPQAGKFGLYVDQLNVAGLVGKSYGLNLAGSINLPKLKIEVVSAQQGQAACG